MKPGEWISMSVARPVPGQQVLFGVGMDMGQVVVVGHIRADNGQVLSPGLDDPLYWMMIPPVPFCGIAGGRA